MSILGNEKALKKIAVVGAGSWGTAVANVFAENGHEVTLWGRDAKSIEEIALKHENRKYLAGLALSPNLKASTDLPGVLENAEWVVCAIPTQQIRNVFSPVLSHWKDKLIVNTSKGLELGTNLRVSQVFAQMHKDVRYAILSGPSFAVEVVQKLPTAVTVSSREYETLSALQAALSNSYFRTYIAKDVVGVEVAGAMKNVVAIAAGMVGGLHLGYNAQAAIINRGIAEMARIGKTQGADPLTFLGLSGTGDLILTCTGPLSRNRKLGVALGEGKKLEQIIKELGGVAEGMYTCRSAYELVQSLGVEAPITEEVYKILYEGGTPLKALSNLMGRDPKEEWL